MTRIEDKVNDLDKRATRNLDNLARTVNALVNRVNTLSAIHNKEQGFKDIVFVQNKEGDGNENS
jgi:hypothetical protein